MHSSLKRISHVLSVGWVLLLTGWIVWYPPDAVLALTFTVVNTNDAGAGSLRQAILDANANTGQDTVVFEIPTSDPGYDASTGTWVITPQTPLPCLTDYAGTIIDGATQATFAGDTNVWGPEIVLKGDQLGGAASLICTDANANHVLGMVLRDAPGPAVNVTSLSSGNIIKDNYIGTGAYGVTAAPNEEGIHIHNGSKNNVIAHNVIAGNEHDGIVLLGDETKIRRNTVGLVAAGSVVLPNGWDGIAVYDGDMNVIGGTEGFRNIVAGNGLNGIRVDAATQTEISYNIIGLDSGGTEDQGNGDHGVLIENGGQGTTIYRNIIAGNDKSGVLIQDAGSDYNYVHDNLIGTGFREDILIGNGHHGVGIYDGPYRTYVGDRIWEPDGNVIVGSGWSGVVVVNGCEGTVIGLNAIGTNQAGAASMGNASYGVHVFESWDTEIVHNHIAYNGAAQIRAGVRIEGPSALRNTISQNSIHDNSGLGIELANGGNGGIASPTITQADCWQIEGQACAGCTVEIFSDDAFEGRRYEGTAPAHSTLNYFAYNGNLWGPNVTATVTDDQGNTSGFGGVGNVCFHNLLPVVVR
jgi:parallel beta-helix repeat protein